MIKNDIQNNLIEVGTRIILEKGYHGAGLQEILAAANVPKGSFYYYFKSKEDFCVAMINHFTAEYAEKRLSLLSDPSTPARERLQSFFAIERDNYQVQDCPLGCLGVKLIMEMSRLSQPIRIVLQQAVDTWVRAVATCLQNGVDAHEFQLEQSPEVTAELINAIWIGAIARVLASQSVAPMDVVIAYIMHQICHIP
ncbi:MAG TPA: TetR/AcrR family transcriptional regulator [Bacillota bacterium]|nr:TetR/AcrR family transcriptional regulator [Bacillota bacterium]